MGANGFMTKMVMDKPRSGQLWNGIKNSEFLGSWKFGGENQRKETGNKEQIR